MQLRRDLEQYRLLTCAQMAAADRQTMEGGLATGQELMDNAGSAVLDVILRSFGDAPRVHILCGPGNNGGDGYVVARLLKDRGHPVTVYAFGSPKEGTDAEKAAARWSGAVLPLSAFEPGDGDLVVDAVFGAGGRGALPAEVASALSKTDNPKVRLLAIDIPSGVEGDTGFIRFDMACDATVTFYRLKPGHVLEHGRTVCGDTTVADIGVRSLTEPHAAEAVFENDPEAWRAILPTLSGSTHKYARGHAAIFSGPALSTGASRLSALSAQIAGAGAVTLLGHRTALNMQATQMTSVMLREYDTPESVADVLEGLSHCSAVVLGPGFGDMASARAIALGVLEKAEQTLVLDADGLTAFANSPNELFEAARCNKGSQLILTPHEGEFRRLFPDLAKDQSLSKLEKAAAAAQRANAVIVYKGPDTIIAEPPHADGGGLSRLFVNTHMSPSLATAGSGDVLAGLIAGLVAQGMPTFEAVCASVWLHGEAGIRAGANANAEALLALLPSAFKAAQSA